MIVKKTFSTLLMALPLMAAMTSCSDNDVAGNAGNSKSYIGFDVQTSRKTRGTVMDLNALKAKKNFTIYSYVTDQQTWSDFVQAGNFDQTDKQNPFTGQVINYDENDNKWSYLPLKLWPQDKKITFLSYWAGDANEVTEAPAVSGNAPKVVTPELSNNSALKLKLNQHKDASKQLDFLTAVSEDYTIDKNAGNVKVKFAHITTRLTFGAKIAKPIGDPTNTQFQAFVTGVKLLKTSRRLFTGATYTFGKATKSGTWSYDNGVGISADADIDTDNIFIKDNAKFGLFAANQGVALHMDKVEAKPLLQADKYLFLIPPHDQEGIKQAGDIIARVSYTIASGNTDLSPNNQKIEYTTDVALPVGTLKAGVAYRINFCLNVDGNIIKIDPAVEVEEWTEETHDAAEATAATVADIQTAWNQLAAQNANPDSKYEYYTINVEENMPTALDLSAGYNEFKPGAIINIQFKDGGKLKTLQEAGNLTLPDKYVLDDTEASDPRNLIRRKNIR